MKISGIAKQRLRCCSVLLFRVQDKFQNYRLFISSWGKNILFQEIKSGIYSTPKLKFRIERDYGVLIVLLKDFFLPLVPFSSLI